MPQVIDSNSISLEKSWISSYPVGSRIYKADMSFKVLSAGIDFLVLKREPDGLLERVHRNTVESLEYSSLPRARSVEKSLPQP